MADHVGVVTGDSGGVAFVDPGTGQLVASLAGFGRSAGVLQTVTDAASLVWVSDFDNGTVAAYPLGPLGDALDSADSGAVVEDIGERSVEVGGNPRSITPAEGGVLVELFSGGQAVFIDEVTFAVTLLSPGQSQEGPLVTNDSTNDTTRDTATVTETTEVGTSFVHNVVGTTESEARAILEEEGFEVATSRSFSDTVAAGLVISTSPAPLTEAPSGSTVTIVDSRGPRSNVTIASVPDQVARE